MEAHARAPDPLVKTENMARTWYRWKEDFIIFLKLTGYINKPNDVKVHLLKNRIGVLGTEAIDSINFERPQDKEKLDILLEKLDGFFDPAKNEIVEHYNFFSRTRKGNESIEDYVNVLKEKAKSCNFGELADTLILDRVILDTNDKILRRKLFDTEELDLAKVISIYKSHPPPIEKKKETPKQNNEVVTKHPIQNQQSTNNDKKGCWRCKTKHAIKACPAWGHKCETCGELNHFAANCQKKKEKEGGISGKDGKDGNKRKTNINKDISKLPSPNGDPLKVQKNTDVKNINKLPIGKPKLNNTATTSLRQQPTPSASVDPEVQFHELQQKLDRLKQDDKSGVFPWLW